MHTQFLLCVNAFARFKDRLNELNSKLSAHDEEKAKLSASQHKRVLTEQMKLAQVVDLCGSQSLADDFVVAGEITKEREERKRALAEGEKPKPKKKRSKQDSSLPFKERSVLRSTEDVQFIKKECLHCRTFGHVVKFCPLLATAGKEVATKCWRCGKEDHTLPQCTEPEDSEVRMYVFDMRLCVRVCMSCMDVCMFVCKHFPRV